ncbi:MAG TPA: helix-turn-helix transcriptional regulator [Candidatus Methylacidiphilales bacterium]
MPVLLSELIPGSNALLSNFVPTPRQMASEEIFNFAQPISKQGAEAMRQLPALLPYHPIKPHFERIATISERLSRGRWRENPFYRDISRYLDYEDQLCINFSCQGYPLLGLCTMRDGYGFSTRERTIAALLVPHLRQAFENACRFSPDTAAHLATLGLSPREAEILHWIAQGKRNGEVATILGISLFTVKNHVRRIFAHLGVETRTAAAAFATPPRS